MIINTKSYEFITNVSLVVGIQTLNNILFNLQYDEYNGFIGK